MASRPKMLVLGLGGIAWSDLVARIRADKLPGIEAVMRRGVAMRLIDDVRGDRAASWASLATGVLPHQHGVVGLREEWAGGLRPTGRSSFAFAPIQDRLATLGLRTRSVAWPFMYPGSAWDGVHVDDRYAHATGRDWREWLMPRDVAPDAWKDAIEEVRVHPTDITSDLLRPFVPALEVVDQRSDRTLVDLALAVARLSTNHAAARTLASRDDWDVAFIFHLWLADLLPRFAGRPAPHDGIADAAWTLLDTMVAATLTAVPVDTRVVLVSLGLRGEAGFIAAAGGGLASGVRSDVAHSLDLVPSILAYHGAHDPLLTGRSLFDTPAATTEAPSARDLRVAVAPDAASLDRVAAAGYARRRSPAPFRARRLLALATFALPHDPEGASRLATAAIDANGEEPHALGILAAAAVAQERVEDLPAIADRIAAVASGHVWEALVRGGWHALRGEAGEARPYLLDVEARGGIDEWMRVGAAWLALDRAAEARRVFSLVLDADRTRTDAMIGLGIAESVFDPIAAERTLRRVLTLDGAAVQARAVLTDLLRRTGRSREADQLAAQQQRYEAGRGGPG